MKKSKFLALLLLAVMLLGSSCQKDLVVDKPEEKFVDEYAGKELTSDQIIGSLLKVAGDLGWNNAEVEELGKAGYFVEISGWSK